MTKIRDLDLYKYCALLSLQGMWTKLGGEYWKCALGEVSVHWFFFVL